MQRYGTTAFTLMRQPRPADREARYRIPKDHTAQRPRREAEGHV